MDTGQRLDVMRESVLKRKRVGGTCWPVVDMTVNARALRVSEAEPSWQIRRGMVVRERLRSLRFAVEPCDSLAGKLAASDELPSDSELTETSDYLRRYPNAPGQTGHCELDLDPLMAKGLDGIVANIESRLPLAAPQEATVYHSFLLALEGLSAMIERAATDAEAAGRTEIADSCRRIAHRPPGTFRDGIQLLWLVLMGVMEGDQVALVVPGHLDRTLFPLYEREMAAGTLTREAALELIGSLYLLINDYIPDGLAMSVMVGGRNAEGNDVTNEISYLCLEALPLTRLIYPTVGVCWHEGTPEALTELAVRLMGSGCPTPALFGDETIQRGLRALGVPSDEASHYINSTCVEITPSRSSNVWVASPYFNTCRLLLDEIAEQVQTSPAQDFESFQQAYYARLTEEVTHAIEQESENRRLRQVHGRKPLQSVFTRDCIARGHDIDDGGARYNWVECSFVGLANLADSLYAVRETVFREESLTLAQLKSALDVNYENHESLRLRLLNRYPKYGQDVPDVDALFGDTVAVAQRACTRRRLQPDDSPFVPGAFCWVMHEILGRECGATPDGRYAGTPFADGCGPAQGREKRGPTAAILSTTSWDHSPMIGGLAMNMKFARSMFDTPKGFEALRHLVLAFLRRGGFETQVNVVDAETLRRAQAQPDAYRDLVVRIGGYCDYFTRLSPEMQEEIILRTEFSGA